MNTQFLQDLLAHHLQDLYSAEGQVLQAMPAIIERANHNSLKNALQHHLDLTTDQQKRLEKAIKLLNETPEFAGLSASLSTEKTCKGMAGLIEEVNELLMGKISKDVTDAAIISCIQKIEHYEICGYGTAVAYAKQLGLHKVEQLLTETLNEEYEADDLLTALATSSYNKEAAPAAVEMTETIDQAQTGNTNSARNNKVSITERNINSPGGRAGTSHRGYSESESRGH